MVMLLPLSADVQFRRCGGFGDMAATMSRIYVSNCANHIDEAFRRRQEGYREHIPASLWPGGLLLTIPSELLFLPTHSGNMSAMLGSAATVGEEVEFFG